MNYNECMTGNTCEDYKWMEIFIAVIVIVIVRANTYINDNLRRCHIV